MNNVKVLAYYLPQYYPCPENNEWWGEGYTEWTTVAKAKPLFPGHHQPKIPSNLGFYDLRLPQVREEQARLASAAGVSAFCYWHYWFGGGRQLLTLPLQEVLRLHTPLFPFCLSWGNHSWYNKYWNIKKGALSAFDSKLLIEQKYMGDEDDKEHFMTMLPAFKDERYFRIDGRLVFVIYEPLGLPDFTKFKKLWNELAQKEGLGGFYFIAHTWEVEKVDAIRELAFDAINLSTHHYPFSSHRGSSIAGMGERVVNNMNRLGLMPRVISYRKAIKKMNIPLFDEDKIYPTLIPNWDHTPRSGRTGRLFQNCTPELFRLHIQDMLGHVQHKDETDQVLFLKSWNEWGEGNYMEPDLEYGDARIKVLGEEIAKFNKRKE